MRGLKTYLGSLAPRLPRDVYVLEAGALVNAFGNGVVLPFLLIYLHDVRGISFGLAGAAAAVQSAAALASGFAGGTLSDRLGPKRVLLGALVVMTVAFALMPLIRSALDAFLVYTLWGIGSGSFWPSQSAMLAGLTPAAKRAPGVRAAAARDERRRRARRRHGGLDRVGRRSRQLHRPLRDQLRDVPRLLRRAHARTRAGAARRSARAGAGGRCCTDRVFTRFTLLNAAFMTAGISLAVEILPAFGKNVAHINEREVGIVFALNAIGDRPLPAPRREALGGTEPDARLRAHGDSLDGVAARDRRRGSLDERDRGVRDPRRRDARLRGRRVPPRRDPGPAQRRPRAAAPRRALSRRVEHLVADRLDRRPRRREASSSSTGRSLLWPLAAGANLVFAALALRLERDLPDGVRRTPHAVPEVVAPAPTG